MAHSMTVYLSEFCRMLLYQTKRSGMIGPFEELPHEIVQRICLMLHKHYMTQIHAFIVKYVPDPCVKPRRFFDYYLYDRFVRYQAMALRLSPVGDTRFCRRNTRMETLLVHNLIHNPL